MKPRVITVLLTPLFVGVVFGGLFFMTTDVSATGDMSGCPFVIQGEAVCSMSALDHVGAWKSMFLVTIPELTLLLAALVAAIVASSSAPNLLLKHIYRAPPLSKEFVQRIYSFSYRPWQDLFSNGILHPKLF